MDANKSGSKPVRGAAAEQEVNRPSGPVDNPEEHVSPEWWRHIFNPLYLKTDGDVVDDREITEKECAFFSERLELKPADKILDLCCGQGRHTLELAGMGFKNVEGLDRSRYLIQKGKARAKKGLLEVKFREGDARKLPYQADTFNAVLILGNSFGYFETVQEDITVLKEVFRVLKPWGRLLVDVADGSHLRGHFQPRSWEWIDANLFVCRERSLSSDGQRLITREIVNHVQEGVVADQFYAVRLYDREGIIDVLGSAGFTDVKFQGSLSPASRRNQDLGMMEERIILTAAVRKEWSHARGKKREKKNVVVVMGDPTRPDPTKPFCIFDDDDFYTIDRLKEALRDIEGYNFTYMNNHSGLVQELMKNRGKVDLVFNLCDEGFSNQARQELHIPAVLDMLGLNYTGAGPQCLSFCYDKSLVRGVSSEIGIPVAGATFIYPGDTTFDLNLSFPVLVKPNLGDSSFGITRKSVAYTPDGLLEAVSEIRDKLGYDKPILVEEFLPGKDLTLGVVGNPPESYTVFPITEEDYSTLPKGLPRICGYEAKWLPDSPYWNIKHVRAELPAKTEKAIVEWSLKLFERLECRDYARFDWRLNAKGEPRLLEVNPNPGWCWDGHLAAMAEFDGVSYPKMLGAILRAAEKRIGLETIERKREEGEDIKAAAGAHFL